MLIRGKEFLEKFASSRTLELSTVIHIIYTGSFTDYQ